MSRKSKAISKSVYLDPIYGSPTLSKFINFIMFDGKKATAERIIYSTF